MTEAAVPFADAWARRPGQSFWVYTTEAEGKLWSLVVHPFTNEIVHLGPGVWKAFPGH